MNNLKYYNDSLAYDFDMFMPSEARKAKKEDNIIKLAAPKPKKKTRRAIRAASVSAFTVMLAVFMLSALCGNLFLRLQINEVNSKINDMKSQINELDSEKTALEMEFERRISYSNIELEATELGMKKMSKDQVQYIRVNDKNAAITSDGKLVEAE
jgi:cell division protein FtsL